MLQNAPGNATVIWSYSTLVICCPTWHDRSWYPEDAGSWSRPSGWAVHSKSTQTWKLDVFAAYFYRALQCILYSVIYYYWTIWFTAADLFHWRPRSGVDAKHCKAFEKFAATKMAVFRRLTIPSISHGYPMAIPWPTWFSPKFSDNASQKSLGSGVEESGAQFFLTQPIGYEKIKDVKCWSPLELVSVETESWINQSSFGCFFVLTHQNQAWYNVSYHSW